MKRLKKMDLFTVCNALIMTLVVLLSVYPLYYAVVNSLNDGTNTTNFGMVQLWPRQFSLDSWRMVVKDPAIPTALGITASRTVIVTVCQLIFTSMFAYAFSRPYLRFKKCYAALGFMSMYISGGIVATFLLLSKMGLYNTYWVYIIPSLFGGFYNVIIYTSNFRGIPDELFESAQLDGASDQCEGENYVLEGTRKDILENKCALVVKEGSDIKSWDDFEAAIKAANSSDDLTFAMGNADVPVGQYTSKILTSLGLNEQDMVNKGIITYGTNVKAVTSAVSSGAADCGIIYATDAYSAEMTPVGYADPEMTGGPCIYPVAVMQNSKHQEEAKKFVDYLFSEEAMAFFTEVGFTEIEA